MHQNSPRLLRDCSTIEETMKLFLSEAMPRTVSAVCAVDQACRVSTPYPHIFDRSLSAEGQIAEVERPYSQGNLLNRSIESKCINYHLLRNLYAWST